ncbi:membrane protein insertion efficiency factor YidD [Candidatus Berkelbacteria bacterium]|nr:membrane protein insertion efficiency factor YidD [Candidatus Berkelbacteria bacterium]
MLKKLLLSIIRLYQATLSPDHGWFKNLHPQGYCRFQPTCSCYTHQAIERFGSIKGSWLGIKRILRCNPWTKPGLDPIPN